MYCYKIRKQCCPKTLEVFNMNIEPEINLMLRYFLFHLFRSFLWIIISIISPKQVKLITYCDSHIVEMFFHMYIFYEELIAQYLYFLKDTLFFSFLVLGVKLRSLYLFCYLVEKRPITAVSQSWIVNKYMYLIFRKLHNFSSQCLAFLYIE